MVIVFNSVIGGFCWVVLVNRCPITANCPTTLSDYSSAEWLVKNKAANAPITFEEIVMVMINMRILLSVIRMYKDGCLSLKW